MLSGNPANFQRLAKDFGAHSLPPIGLGATHGPEMFDVAGKNLSEILATRCRSGRRKAMTITESYVRDVFKSLENGDGADFFKHVDENVDWIVEGTHPLAGHYRSKAQFIAGTFDKLAKVLPNGAQLVVEHLLVKGDEAVVELHSLATAKNGLRFDNRYCWVVHFKDKTIDRVRAYLDSAMVALLFEQNPI
jgi:ketosteroid isomerase-like protein